jgi:hypothetical protein
MKLMVFFDIQDCNFVNQNRYADQQNCKHLRNFKTTRQAKHCKDIASLTLHNHLYTMYSVFDIIIVRLVWNGNNEQLLGKCLSNGAN